MAKEYLCSHLVTLHWDGRRASANLEKIWDRGATVNAEECIARGAEVRIASLECDLKCRVVSCLAEEAGHFIDVEFADEYVWSPERFEPDHMTDPDILLVQKLLQEIAKK